MPDFPEIIPTCTLVYRCQMNSLSTVSISRVQRTDSLIIFDMASSSFSLSSFISLSTTQHVYVVYLLYKLPRTVWKFYKIVLYIRLLSGRNHLEQIILWQLVDKEKSNKCTNDLKQCIRAKGKGLEALRVVLYKVNNYVASVMKCHKVEQVLWTFMIPFRLC